MTKSLGLIEALEALLLDSPRVPLSKKIMVNEDEVLDMVNKLRVLIKEDSNNQVIPSTSTTPQVAQSVPTSTPKPEQDLVSMQKKADELINGANEYADYTLAQLQLVVSQIQKTLIKAERYIDNGRQVLDKKKT